MKMDLRFWLGCGSALLAPVAGLAASRGAVPQVQHVIIIMQENRSFDNYFGTYPGANGIPSPAPCLPQSMTNPMGPCVASFHDVHAYNAGSVHDNKHAILDLNDGLTASLNNGFVNSQITLGLKQGTTCDTKTLANMPASCYPIPDGVARHDVMGYHNADEIPNYWAYAQHFTLNDAMFPGVRGWSGAVHLQMTSEWSASCKTATVTSTCTTNLNPKSPTATTEYPWASLFQFYDVQGVSWRYYLGSGTEPDCDGAGETCAPAELQSSVYGFWNPAPYFAYVKAQGPTYLASHVVKIDSFLADIKNATLQQVSYVVPSQDYSEHPIADTTLGMDYTTSLINAVMQSPYWQNTVIFLAWDDWGGFYDHVVPPYLRQSANGPAYGFGIRVPALTISAYVKANTVDHAVYSFDSYTRFIEDMFAGGTRFSPAALGNPDSRPYIADSVITANLVGGGTVAIGDLKNEFNFNQTPLTPLVLPTSMPGGFRAICSTVWSATCTKPTVALSWLRIGANTGVPTYHVTRDGVEIGGACVTTKTSCSDTPPAGDHLYRIYSVIGGVSSAVSPAYEIVMPTTP